MNKLRFLTVLFLAVLAFLPYRASFAEEIPVNLIPMYGAPADLKTDDQKKADEVFIQTVVKSCGSRQKGAIVFSGEGGNYLAAGDVDTAMRRFNQCWLLDPESFLSYWGFGKIYMKTFMLNKAIPYYERSLSLIDSNQFAELESYKPLLLTDAAIAYSLASIFDKSKAADFQVKSCDLLRKVVAHYPNYSPAYKVWIDVYMDKKEYAKAWEVVKKARVAGVKDLNKELIEALSQKMPEPQS